MTRWATRHETEDQFQARVIKLAMDTGWMVCHYLPAIRQSGRWSTAVQGHRGAPDLILARRGVVLLVELKTETGQPSRDQRKWLAHLGDHGRVWRPRDWDRIVETLRSNDPVAVIDRTSATPPPHRSLDARRAHPGLPVRARRRSLRLVPVDAPRP